MQKGAGVAGEDIKTRYHTERDHILCHSLILSYCFQNAYHISGFGPDPVATVLPGQLLLHNPGSTINDISRRNSAPWRCAVQESFYFSCMLCFAIIICLPHWKANSQRAMILWVAYCCILRVYCSAKWAPSMLVK